jgi:hypothetical protein
MALQRVAIAVTLLNLGLLVFQVSRHGPVTAQQIPAVLRGRALEIVDDQGRVRASISVQPPTTVDEVRYPETVLLRLTDPASGPVVKIDASVEGAGFGLSDDSHKGGIRLMAKSRTGTFVQVTGRNGREQRIKPE